MKDRHKSHPTSRLFIFLCDPSEDSCEAGLPDAVVSEQHHSVNTVRVALRVVVRVGAPLGAVVEGFVPGVVGRRLSERRVAAQRVRIPRAWPSAARETRVPSPGRVLVERRDRCAASPPQGVLLLSLGVQGHCCYGDGIGTGRA